MRTINRQQFLDITDNEIVLVNKIYLDPLLQDNYEKYKDNYKGMSKDGLFRAVCSIPTEVLANDPDGAIFLMTGNCTPEGKISLRKFLEKHPEYKTSRGGI